MSSDRPTRDALVATARESIARGSKSFGLAARLFGRDVRERAYLLYAWCRACDDLADGQDHGHRLGGTGDIGTIRRLTDHALSGGTVGHAAFDGLALLVAETGIPRARIAEHIEGFALDAAGWRPRTEADLIRYCDHVAGVVGRMMALLMGVSPEDEDTLGRANDLGRAFQLANIARDIQEDAQGGRCYLPVDWLKEFGLEPGNLLTPENRPKTAALARRLADTAARYEASARTGAGRLPFRSRWAVLAAAGIYGDIAREVARRGEAALDQRVTTSRRAKLKWVGRALLQSLSP